MKRLVAGCGYLGLRAALLWRDRGDEVFALTRSSDRADELNRQGLHALTGDVTRPESLAQIPDCDTVLHSVAFDRSSAATRQGVSVDGLRHLRDAMTGRCGHFIHTSSTSVYGQSDGEIVDEDSECRPEHESGMICLAAEQLLKVSPSGDPGTRFSILRLAGLYGPARLLSRMEAIRAGTPLPGPSAAWLNLIHVDDAARAVLDCADRDDTGATWLVCDDKPVHRADYYAALARLLNAPLPAFDEAAVARHARGLNKRCSNRRLRNVLGVDLRFPTIESGLRDAVLRS